MPSVNKTTLMGHLGRDPEIRYTPNGTAVCTISLATTSAWKDKTTGERIEKPEWHRIVFYRRLAEVVAEHMTKGRLLYVEGRLSTRKYRDADGLERYVTEVIADEMQMLGKPERTFEGAVEGFEPAPSIEEDDIPF